MMMMMMMRRTMLMMMGPEDTTCLIKEPSQQSTLRNLVPQAEVFIYASTGHNVLDEQFQAVREKAQVLM
eukprot:872886-Karenia_brevis.AAC.1